MVLAISLWIGSLAWTGFIMTRTVLDPGRSEAVANALLDDPDVHDQLVANIAGGLESAIPDGFDVDRATLDAAAETALDSPEVEALFRTALVDTHQAFLGEGDPPRSIDGGAFGSAARAALVESNPELDGLLPASPSLEVPLPTERVPNLGPVRRALDVAVPMLAAVAAFGALMALVVTSNRPSILRRAGVWAIALSAFVLVFAFGIPALAHSFAPSQAAVVASLVGALAEASQGPALALAGAGVAGLVASFLWKPAANAVMAGPQAAPPRQRRSRRSPHPPTQRIPRQPRSRPGSHPPTPPRSAPRPSAPSARPPANPPVSSSGPASAPTTVQRAFPDAARRPPVADQPGRRWVEGTGWVLDGSEAIPSEARWVPGVGYVVDT